MHAHYTHSTDIHILRACSYHDGCDLIAIGGDHGVDILMVGDSQIRVIASFHIGSRVTALAWSPKSVSPGSSTDWILELAVATIDCGLYILTRTSLSEESTFRFGGGLTGHHGKVNDLAFCGGRGENSMRYVGSVSDDKMLMIWDLYPDIQIQESVPGMRISRRQPTAYAIQFSHPLISIGSHVSSDKEFLVADCKGNVYITDWRSDPENAGGLDFRHSNILELTEPLAVISSTGSFGSAVWRPESANIVGAAYGSRFAIWDIQNLNGGQPSHTGMSFLDGSTHFRWCSSSPEYFAITSKRPNGCATLHMYNLDYLKTQPTTVQLAMKSHIVDTIDFVGSGGPRIAAVVGRNVVISNVAAEKSS